MKKVVFFLIIFFLGICGWFFSSAIRPTSSHVLLNQEKSTSPPAPGRETPSITTPGTLSIPSLGITTTIESVGMDAMGAMDVPKNAANVAWYNLGYKIGEKGSAVIAGHFDRANGEPAVFYRLGDLKKGDKIIVSMNTGPTYTYQVEQTKTYEHTAFPLQEVFNTSDKQRMNLITCDGVWNKNTSLYSRRLVVFSTLVH